MGLLETGSVALIYYLLFPIILVCGKINTLSLQSITQLFGHQTSLQRSVCLRINEVTSRIDVESEERHRDVVLVEEQVWMWAEEQNNI